MSFSFSPGMGPRGAIGQFGQAGKDGRFFNKNVILGMLQFVRPYRRKMIIATILMFMVTGFTLLGSLAAASCTTDSGDAPLVEVQEFQACEGEFTLIGVAAGYRHVEAEDSGELRAKSGRVEVRPRRGPGSAPGAPIPARTGLLRAQTRRWSMSVGRATMARTSMSS